MTPEEIKRMNEERKSQMMQKFIVPLIYAPLLPLIRIGFKHNPPVRDGLFAFGIFSGLMHAGYVMSRDSSV